MTAERTLVALLIAGMLAAGCAGIGMSGGGDARMSDQALCEQTRGGGVWVASAGACIRGGGN
jgi:hypothetical protein